MATKPKLIRAIPKTKIKAFDYNYNFDQFQSYVDEVIGDVSGSMPVGAIYQAIRTDVPVNSLRLDGREYTSGFDNFILNYLISGKIITKSYVEWQQEYDNNGGNVGFFAYDADTGKFKVPCIQAGTFLAQAVASGEFGSFLNSSFQSHTHTQDEHAHNRGTMEITGNMSAAAWGADGAFYTTTQGGNGSGDYNPYDIGFQASRSWTGETSYAQPTIHPAGGDDTYPKHIKYPFFVVVSNVEAESPSQVVWDEFVGNLDGKANTDLSNISANGKAVITRIGMPSNRFDELAIGASETPYTAPTDGYFYFICRPNSTGFSQAWLYNTATGIHEWDNTTEGSFLTGTLKVSSGTVVNYGYYMSGGLASDSKLRFYYAEGVK